LDRLIPETIIDNLYELIKTTTAADKGWFFDAALYIYLGMVRFKNDRSKMSEYKKKFQGVSSKSLNNIE
jgi:hypothetical protein